MPHNALLKRLNAFTDLDDEDRTKLVALCRDVRTIAAKRDITSEGDRPERVHLVIDGWAARYKMINGGSRQITAFLIPGDFCDLHVAVLGRMDHSIVALTRCKVAFIESSEMDRLTMENNRLTRAMWWGTLVDEAVLRQWVVNVGRRDAYERVAHVLCELHARMRIVGLVDNNRLALPITQEELADATGLTSVHINRTLQRLRNDNLIELRNGMLNVIDVNELRRAGGFDPSYLHIERRLQ
jgi:CRP-like cAMP-binding protein